MKLNELKMCSFCNKLTANEVVRGDIFCVECGHQRDMVETSSHQKPKAEKKKEYWKSWWYVGIWILLIYFYIPFIKHSPENSSKIKQTDELNKDLSGVRYKVVKNTLQLPKESLQQLSDLTEKARLLITNNLTGQDKIDFITFLSNGSRLTSEESYKLDVLVEKSKNSMSLEDRDIVERFQQEVKKLMK